ncbi:ferritin [Hydrogenovibrio sp. 3SP14C1]|uniref:encapsulin-associated ferritin-like protein n=1 Tax=Hydrogenovibrio sp. 3SP14C1 TaxID=3038774 RepID=UPI002417A121|nr:encapsulin-associated ferritin-like protein [Hydrogenovibrio sp. 3SP14C1]MDG4812569.1 ferritin [Hydrogenovibrio sp. 3SP14C1]
MSGYHEPVNELSHETRDMHRALMSIMEEFEAIDWYNQRIETCQDEALKSILIHNRDEEKEHASMMLEWVRRKDKALDQQMKEYLFTDKPITDKG